LQPHPFVLLQASDDIEQLRRRRISFWSERLMEGLEANAVFFRSPNLMYDD
jgi:hypothetical protein